VVDIDLADDDLLKDSLKRHGETPIIIRTASGKYHIWYLFNGEDRKIRPDPQVPVDIWGGGVVVAPRSKGATGSYEFIRGSLGESLVQQRVEIIAISSQSHQVIE
jgi:hypothetical protein